MRSVLVVVSDSGLLNRIRVVMQDSSTKYYFCESEEEALDTIETKELAVALISLSMPLMDGQELIECIANKSSKTRIILLFDEGDVERALDIHNQYHLCKMICSQNSGVDEFPEFVEKALSDYNRSDEIKKIEIRHREKEEKYRMTMIAMKELLEGKQAGIEQTNIIFRNAAGYLACNGKKIQETVNSQMISYCEEILKKREKIFELKSSDMEQYFETLVSESHKPEEKRYLKLECHTQIPTEEKLSGKVTFVLDAITDYYRKFYKFYRAKIMLSEIEGNLVCNVLFDIGKQKLTGRISDSGIELLKHLTAHYSDQAAFGSQEGIFQYKMIYFAGENHE